MKKIAGIENTLFCLCDRNKYYGIIEVLGNDIILKTTSLKHANLYFKAEACMILKKIGPKWDTCCHGNRERSWKACRVNQCINGKDKKATQKRHRNDANQYS